MARAVHVRPATPADAPRAARLLHDFNAEFGWATPPPAVLAERLERMLSRPETTGLLLAEAPADGLALLSLRPSAWSDGPAALLEELYVPPALRDGGIGTALLAAAIELARGRGASLVEINVDEGDTDAQRFYERHGFTGIEPETGGRALYFQRELS